MEARMHAQQQQNTCAVAATRTILDLQYGINIDEPILEAFGSKAKHPIRAEGAGTTELRRMIRLASEAYNTSNKRWRLRVRLGGTRRQLDRLVKLGHYPMVSIMQDDSTQLHMVVVLDVSPGLVQLFDPSEGEVLELPWAAFAPQWEDDHWFAVVHDGSI